MAEEKKGLSSVFNSVVKHMFSPTMIIMMMLMSLPAVGAMAVAAGKTATLGDIAVGTADMFWQMISAPFTDGGVVADAFSNAASGDFASSSYSFGGMEHTPAPEPVAEAAHKGHHMP